MLVVHHLRACVGHGGRVGGDCGRGGRGGHGGGRRPVGVHTLAEALLQTVLELCVAHDEYVLFVPGHEADPVRDPGVKAIEAGQHVRHVQPRPAVLHHLVEHVVPEQLEHVSVAVLGPAKVPVQLGAVHHRAQLGQEAEETRGLHLLGQLALYHVVAHVGCVELGVKPCSYEGYKKIKVI